VNLDWHLAPARVTSIV